MTDEQKELNRRIAERLGWTVVPEKLWNGKLAYTKVRPDGFFVFSSHPTEEEAWKYLPNWAGSVDKALELLAGQRFSLNYSPDGHSAYDKEQRQCQWECQIVEYTQSLGAAVANAPALAICKAWLTWQESKEGER